MQQQSCHILFYEIIENNYVLSLFYLSNFLFLCDRFPYNLLEKIVMISHKSVQNCFSSLIFSSLYKIEISTLKIVQSFNLVDYNNEVRKCSFKHLERVFTDKKDHELAKTLYPKVLLWKDDFNNSYQLYTQMTKNLSLLKFGVLYDIDENGERKLFDPVNTFRQEWQEKTLINIVNNDIFDDVMSDDGNERVKVVKSLMHSFSLDFNLDNVLKVSKAMV